MRIGPLGALYRDKFEQMKQVVWESSLTTHGSILAASLSWAVAVAVSLLIEGTSLESLRKELPSIVSQAEKEWHLEHPKWEIDHEGYHVVSDLLRSMFDEQTTDRVVLRQRISELARPHLAPGFKKGLKL